MVKLLPDGQEGECELGQWQRSRLRWNFAGACDALSRAIVLRTFFALLGDQAMLVHVEMSCRLRELQLCGQEIEGNDLQLVLSVPVWDGSGEGREWHHRYLEEALFDQE